MKFFLIEKQIVMDKLAKKNKNNLDDSKKTSIFATSNQENESCLTSCKKPM